MELLILYAEPAIHTKPMSAVNAYLVSYSYPIVYQYISIYYDFILVSLISPLPQAHAPIPMKEFLNTLGPLAICPRYQMNLSLMSRENLMRISSWILRQVWITSLTKRKTWLDNLQNCNFQIKTPSILYISDRYL